jgi:hypothetical protein
MLETRQHPPLGAELPQQFGRPEVGVDDLDRRLLLELVVVSLGPIDDAHAAAADLGGQTPRADARPDKVGVDQRQHRVERGSIAVVPSPEQERHLTQHAGNGAARADCARS